MNRLSQSPHWNKAGTYALGSVGVVQSLVSKHVEIELDVHRQRGLHSGLGSSLLVVNQQSSGPKTDTLTTVPKQYASLLEGFAVCLPGVA